MYTHSWQLAIRTHHSFLNSYSQFRTISFTMPSYCQYWRSSHNDLGKWWAVQTFYLKEDGQMQSEISNTTGWESVLSQRMQVRFWWRQKATTPMCSSFQLRMSAVCSQTMAAKQRNSPRFLFHFNRNIKLFRNSCAIKITHSTVTAGKNSLKKLIHTSIWQTRDMI